MNTVPKKIVIIGGGFAGIFTARRLAKTMKQGEFSIRLVTNKSFFEHYPALYRLVTGASPIEVCVPLVDLIPSCIEIVEDTIVHINTDTKEVVGMSESVYEYDTLVFAVGSETNFFAISGLPEHSFPFKSVTNALDLKKHLQDLFVNVGTDKTKLVSRFHIVVVGGGPTGVEVAGSTIRYLRHLAQKNAVDPSLITLDIIDSNPRLLAMLPEVVSRRVEARLRSLGVNVFLNRTLLEKEVETIVLGDMTLYSQTLIWTAGTRTNTLVTSTANLTLSPRKRIVVDEYLRAQGLPDVFVAGDIADTLRAGLAQSAIYDGTLIAENIVRAHRGKKLRTYQAPAVGNVVPVGRRWGALAFGKVTMFGYIPYLIREMIDLKFFLSILPVYKVIQLYVDGWKYRDK